MKERAPNMRGTRAPMTNRFTAASYCSAVAPGKLRSTATAMRMLPLWMNHPIRMAAN